MVKTNLGFRLGAYLKDISCELTLPSGEQIEFDEISYSDGCSYEMETMVHDFWASAIADAKTVNHSVGILRVNYHLSFTGHPYEEPSYFETVVPLVDRT